jgi:aminopeptidase
MMRDPRDQRLAELLVQHSAEVAPGDRVALYGSSEAEPLLRALYREVLRAGGHPYPFLGFDVYMSYGGFDEIFFRHASDEQLKHVYETEKMVKSDFEAMILIRSKRNTRSLTGVEAARQRIRNQAFTAVNQAQFERGSARELKWVVTIYPTEAQAQEAELSLEEFSDFIYAACLVDRPDPARAWREVHDRQQKLVDWLQGKDRIEMKGSNLDLRLSISGRQFINAAGKFNMPSGEIFTGPVEESVEGWVRFTYPAALLGTLVEGIELRFENGRIVDASAATNEGFLQELLQTDEGARYLGEWAIGTNDRINRFTKAILIDEKIGGTIHVAIGAGYPETGSVNQSAIHWDMITDMKADGEIWVDGELFYRRGEFLI